jgi:hypothetical protein
VRRCACLLLITSFAAAAQDPQAEVTFRGFGTVGAVHSDTDGAQFIRDVRQSGGVADGWNLDVDTRVGIQVDARRGQLEGAIQALAAHDHVGGYGADLSWAFIAYSPVESIRLRAGRVGWDAYMFSDTRDVGYAQLWVRPPVEYFGWLIVNHLDGADVSVHSPLGAGVVTFRARAGRARQRIPVEDGGSYEVTGSRLEGAHLDYRRGDWSARVGYTAARLRHPLAAFSGLRSALLASGAPNGVAIANGLNLAGKRLRAYSAALVYDGGPWTLQAMASRLTSDAIGFPQRDSAYLHAGYRIGRWAPYATASTVHSRDEHVGTGLALPNPLDDALASAFAASRSRQSTLSAGLRFDFARNADLKVQLDRVRVRDGGANLWVSPRPGWNGRATLLSVSLDYIF